MCLGYFILDVYQKLKLNEDKTEVILIGTPAKIKTIDVKNVELCGEQITISNKARNLGVVFDSSFAMEQPITQLRQTCYN